MCAHAAMDVVVFWQSIESDRELRPTSSRKFRKARQELSPDWIFDDIVTARSGGLLTNDDRRRSLRSNEQTEFGLSEILKFAKKCRPTVNFLSPDAKGASRGALVTTGMSCCELDKLVLTDDDLVAAGYRSHPFDKEGNYVGAPTVRPPEQPHT